MPDLINLRAATPADVPTIFALIQALADYERLSDAVTGNLEALHDHLFGSRPYAEVVLAETTGNGETASKVAGFALFFL